MAAGSLVSEVIKLLPHTIARTGEVFLQITVPSKLPVPLMSVNSAFQPCLGSEGHCPAGKLGSEWSSAVLSSVVWPHSVSTSHGCPSPRPQAPRVWRSRPSKALHSSLSQHLLLGLGFRKERKKYYFQEMSASCSACITLKQRSPRSQAAFLR